MMYMLDNPRRFAKLLASLNVPGSNRPLSPIEVANEIYALREDLGGDLKETIRRLPISEDIVKEFAWLRKLPRKIQDVVVWGESSKKDGTIGFSAAAKMARLDNHDDVLKLAGAMLDMSRPVTKEEIKGVISLKKRMASKSIDECVREVLNVTRQFTVNHFLFISGIKSNIVATLNEVEHGRHDNVGKALKGVFPPGTLKNTKVSNDHIRLALDEEGWEFISVYSKRHGLPRREVVNHMLESVGFANE